MKPVYLEFCGLNSFSETARIDFQALLKGGVFGIFGDTGSGKSTVLDAIHFALYGEVDRVPKAFADCINRRMEAASVTFDFELTKEGVRKLYRVKREKKRKQGASKAYLYEGGENGAWNALAESTRDVNERLEEIIGLTFEDFKMCIALPQGDFAALVKSTPAERVKLVARLFNLEKYGERLSAAVFAKYKAAEEEVRLVQAKMGENAGGEDRIESLQAKLQAEKAALAALQAAWERIETAVQKAEQLQREKRDFDALEKRLQALTERLGEMEERRALLERAPKAKAVQEQAQTLAKTQTAKREAAARATALQTAHAQKTAALEREKALFEEADYDEKLLKAKVDLDKVRSSADDYKAAQRAEAEYRACRAEYKALLKNAQQEDFAAKKEAFEKELAALGEDENLLDYLKHTYKEVLLADAYGEVRADLARLAQKYPQTQADIDGLLKKYTLSQADGVRVVDIAAVNLAFKQKEAQKKLIKERLEELDKRRRAYEENESKKKLLEKQGALLQQNYQATQAKIAGVLALGTEHELSERVNALSSAQAAARSRMENTQAEIAALYAKGERLQGIIQEQEKSERASEKALLEALKTGGFARVEEAIALLDKIGDEERAKGELQAFFEELAACKQRRKEADEAKCKAFDENALLALQAEKRALKASVDEKNRSLGAAETELKALLALREKYRALEKELAEKQKKERLCEELLKLVRGNRFLEYIACEYLQEICASASKTLLSLTGGRYFLKYEDKEFKVGDNLDGGVYRAVKTLSGGETFLVSLSLALSLSAAICMKSLRPIEFFFLDEGFGTLDEKLVDTVMDVLSKLGKSFSVGLISHVEELKRRVEQKILVTAANESRGSQIRVICY